MFKVIGIIAVIAGIFWLGDTVGIDGIEDLLMRIKEIE